MRKRIFFYLLLISACLSCNKKNISLDMRQISVTTSDRLNKIKFFNDTIGFIGGGEQFTHPTLLKTTNGGLTWMMVDLPTQNEQKEIYGLDVYQDGQVITVGYGGTIFISKDTGATFSYVQHGSWKELKDICFTSNLMSYIIGGTGFKEGHISEFKTDGSGSNQIKENKYFELSDIDRVDSNTFYISGYGAILKSADGGLTWDFTNAKNDFFKAMTWKNTQEGIAVGYEGSIEKTRDGGQTWKVIRNGNSITKKKIHFWDVERNQQQSLVAVGDGGAVFVSSDDGDTWTEASSNTTQDLRGVFFRNDASCFVVGDHGTVFEIRF